MSNCDSISSSQNIALTSGTDRSEEINVNPDNRFSGHTPADCSDRKDKLFPYHNVTNGRDKVMEGGAVVSTAQLPRKLFLVHRKLLTDINRCHADLLARDSQSQFDFESFNLGVLQEVYDNFLKTLKSFNDEELPVFREFLKDVIERFPNCAKVCKVRKDRLGKKQDNANRREPNSDVDIEMRLSDSISQVSSGNSAAPNSFIVARCIELERQRAELQSNEVMAKVKPRKLRLLAEAEEAEMLAKLRLESIKLETEEKSLACSERGSSVSAQTKTSKTKIALRPRVVGSLLEPSQPNQKAMNFTKFDMKKVIDAKRTGPKTVVPSVRGASHKSAVDPQQTFAGQLSACLAESGHQLETPRQMPYTCVEEGWSLWMTYLERPGRNAFINLTSQMAYDDSNMTFVYYENQIRKVMSESPCHERRLEVFRASCKGQPREMANLFIAPMRSTSTAQQIEKALDRLCQRYGVSGGFTSKPKVRAIRYGPKVAFTSNSLKFLNEDLNLLEVFAYAHDETTNSLGNSSLIQLIACRISFGVGIWIISINCI